MVIWLIKPMQRMKRVTHLTSNISTNPLWNVCTQDRCQKDINRQLLENFSFATVDKSIIQTVLPVIWQSVHRPRIRHLQLFTLNSNKPSVTKRHIIIYQLQTFQSYVTKSTSELISTNHLRFSSWFKDSLSWLSLSNSMKTFIKISAPIYMSFSSSVSWTRECWIQARNSLIFVLNIDQWLTVMIFFLSFVSSLRHHLTSNNRVQQWTQDLLAILTFFNPRGNCLSLIGDHSQHS